MSVRYLTLEEALWVCDHFGFQIRDAGLLDSALHRPRSGWGDQEFYATVPLKAAALLHSLVKNHPVLHGNERLSWLLTFMFIRANGYDTAMTNDDVVTLVLWAAAHTGEMDLDALAGRLQLDRTP